MNFWFEPFKRVVLRLLAHQILIISREWMSYYKENRNAYHVPTCTSVIDQLSAQVQFCT